jgi:hypothetical protein
LLHVAPTLLQKSKVGRLPGGDQNRIAPQNLPVVLVELW